MAMVGTTGRGRSIWGRPMRTPHHPVIRQIRDGRWAVTCRDCHRDEASSIPIGIDLPVTSLFAAELIRDNHAGRHAGKQGGTGSLSPERRQSSQPVETQRRRPQTPPAVA